MCPPSLLTVGRCKLTAHGLQLHEGRNTGFLAAVGGQAGVVGLTAVRVVRAAQRAVGVDRDTDGGVGLADGARGAIVIRSTACQCAIAVSEMPVQLREATTSAAL